MWLDSQQFKEKTTEKMISIGVAVCKYQLEFRWAHNRRLSNVVYNPYPKLVAVRKHSNGRVRNITQRSIEQSTEYGTFMVG